MTSSWNSPQNNPAMLVCSFIFCNVSMNKWWNFVSDELIYGRKMFCFVWTVLRPVICECHVMAFKHDDVIKWKHFPRYWPFVRRIHGSPVDSPHKGKGHRAFMFSLICGPDKQLRKLSRRRWFGTPSRSLWRPRNKSPATRNRLTTMRISKLHSTDPLRDLHHIGLVTHKALRCHDAFMRHIF